MERIPSEISDKSMRKGVKMTDQEFLDSQMDRYIEESRAGNKLAALLVILVSIAILSAISLPFILLFF